MISTQKSRSYKQGVQVIAKFTVSQHSRDAKLMRYFSEYLGCGKYYPRSGHNSGEFHVTTRGDIIGKIIPFFDKYSLQGAKSLDFAGFKKAMKLIEAEGHLTSKGLKEILKIKDGMNKLRE